MLQEFPRTRYCGWGLLEGLFECFRSLTFSSHPWRYYQASRNMLTGLLDTVHLRL